MVRPSYGTGSTRASYPISTLGVPNLVITRWSCSWLPTTSPAGRRAVHSWADPPTAVWGQLGSNLSGSSLRAPDSLR